MNVINEPYIFPEMKFNLIGHDVERLHDFQTFQSYYNLDFLRSYGQLLSLFHVIITSFIINRYKTCELFLNWGMLVHSHCNSSYQTFLDENIYSFFSQNTYPRKKFSVFALNYCFIKGFVILRLTNPVPILK